MAAPAAAAAPVYVGGAALVAGAIWLMTPAGQRGPAFSKMSQHIQSAPPAGFLAGHRMGWGIHHATGHAVPNLRAGPNAPRVDLEVHAGRAFGVR